MSSLAWALDPIELDGLIRPAFIPEHFPREAVVPPLLFSSAVSLACLLVEVFLRHGSSIAFHRDGFKRRLGVIRFQVKSVLLRLDARSHLNDHVLFLIRALGFQFFAGAESVAVLKGEASLADSCCLY